MSTSYEDPREHGIPDPHRGTAQFTGDSRRHSDAAFLRRRHGIPRFNEDVFDEPSLLPALFNHTWDGGRARPSGGVEAFATGPPNSGKSTLALRSAAATMEQNNARAVWRAATGSRSEWFPFHQVARVCLPKGYEANAYLVKKERGRDSMGIPVRLEDVVREVRYYSDIMDLNLNVLGDGVFNVVYPDPSMRGCQWVYETSDKRYEGLQYKKGDPVDHWWTAWGASLVERGPFPWTDWFCDEIKTVASEGAGKDQWATLQKITFLADCVEDFRKNGISLFAYGHKDKHLHNLVTDRVRWRICMNGTANPTKGSKSSYPKGFETVPMEKELTTGFDTGEALVFTEERFEEFSWPKISKPGNFDLKVYLEESSPGATASATAGEVADD
ncbi:ATP-binding protein [Halobaculum sp. EA56]|uniref:ATP-binding protein n=1 Tax=Halobaculum sp. EA56 TaxID=3421648 RepID=UPI003EB95EAC